METFGTIRLVFHYGTQRYFNWNTHSFKMARRRMGSIAHTSHNSSNTMAIRHLVWHKAWFLSPSHQSRDQKEVWYKRRRWCCDDYGVMMITPLRGYCSPSEAEESEAEESKHYRTPSEVEESEVEESEVEESEVEESEAEESEVEESMPYNFSSGSPTTL